MQATELARRTDPWTSHEAAKVITADGSRERWTEMARQLLARLPGSTARELEAAGGVSDGFLRKRLGELRERSEAHNGTPRTCSVSGKKAQTWWPGPEIAT